MTFIMIEIKLIQTNNIISVFKALNISSLTPKKLYIIIILIIKEKKNKVI